MRIVSGPAIVPGLPGVARLGLWFISRDRDGRWHKDWAWLAQPGPGGLSSRGIEAGLNPAITDITLGACVACHLAHCAPSRVNNKKLVAGYFLISLLAWWSNLLPGVIWNIQFQTDLNGACGAHYYQSITGLLCIQSLALQPGSPHSVLRSDHSMMLSLEWWSDVTPIWDNWDRALKLYANHRWGKCQSKVILLIF